jgi:hypothetical protein
MQLSSYTSQNTQKRRQKRVVFINYRLKNRRNAIFYAKELNKILPNVFEEYMTFKMFCSLRQCGGIPVQSFGSHIRPQPSGLGLIITLTQSRRLYCGRENINLKIAEIRH